jgi:phosphatidate cytidylyltransferase
MITGVVLGVAVTAAILFLPTLQAAAVLGILWLVGVWEWGGLARLGGTARLAYAAAHLVVMVPLLLFGATLAFIDVLLGLALAAWCIALVGVVTYPLPIRSVWVGIAGPVAVLPAWVILAFMHSRGALGPELALTALALVWAADVGAYAAGRSFGRIKLAPRVSPGKTWEGVTGGLTLALIVALAVSFWLGLPALPLAVVAVATALISVVGDLTVSMLKRNVGLKDTGKLLPGHGGVMDRIDGLVAAVPVYAVGLRVCGVLG